MSDLVPELPGLILAATFVGGSDFGATRLAENWIKGQGMSVGRNQRGAPRGVLKGDFNIQKWRNLNRPQRQALDGFLIGDARQGPLRLYLRPTPPTVAEIERLDRATPAPAEPED